MKLRRRRTNAEAETKVLKRIRDVIRHKPPLHIVVIVLVGAMMFGALAGAVKTVAGREAPQAPQPTSTTIQQFIGVPSPGETKYVPKPGPTVTVTTKPGGVTRQEVVPSKTTDKPTPTESKIGGASSSTTAGPA